MMTTTINNDDDDVDDDDRNADVAAMTTMMTTTTTKKRWRKQWGQIVGYTRVCDVQPVVKKQIIISLLNNKFCF